MARNKHPEVTVEKILVAAKRLFLEKGYEATTIQDIVDQLGGLTKGAVYHHFKSKDQIMYALGDQLFFENNPFTAIKGRTDLNGLQKIRAVIALNEADVERQRVSIEAMPILKNPPILAAALESNQRVLTPLWQSLIEEGVRDGSIQTVYARELAELLPLLSFWLTPSIYPATAEVLHHRFHFVVELFTKMGLPIWDEATTALAEQTLAEMTLAEMTQPTDSC